MKLACAIFLTAILTACAAQPAPQPRAEAPAKKSAAAAKAPESPGAFDYYVLAMSWSPEHCSTKGKNDRMQCAGERLYDFVLHGLWPQYEKGYPADCSTDPIDRNTVDAMLDIMPAPGLVRYEWRKHGTCSGMDPKTYYARARQAFTSVKVPRQYQQPKVQVISTPDEVRSRFAKENPTFAKDSVAAVCSGRFLQEVRICFTKDLKSRACSADVLRNQCRVPEVILRPVR
ncbi:ribonuclease [Bryobacterales bacterium F-183]|nr:ribonuclease [Bryobacterales bacterium F-183]